MNRKRAREKGPFDLKTILVDPVCAKSSISLDFACINQRYPLMLTMSKTMSFEGRWTLSGLAM